MFRICTETNLFRYGTINCSKPVSVTWSKVDENKGTCFTGEELKALHNYFKSKPDNFYNPKIFDCFKEIHEFGFSRNLSERTTVMPNQIILTKKPSVYKSEELSKCMEIILIGIDGKDNHEYDLGFEVIGQMSENF